MKLFSQRKGIKSVKTVIQVDGIDGDLRNGLWDALTVFYWKGVSVAFISDSRTLETLFERLWHNYFKEPLDTLDDEWRKTYRKTRGYFFSCDWNEAYDFIEFVANNYPLELTNKEFMDFCNTVLERELSAYRFVGAKITQITSETEISEIEEAIEGSRGLKGVNAHLKTGLDYLANRKSPDYRNSIKESISAVESLCRLVARNDKATLGQALKQIQDKVSIHPALKSAFSSLYGYTSDAEGIRHALLDESKVDFEDAKFMLVSCSAFVNYLVAKAAKAGMPL